MNKQKSQTLSLFSKILLGSGVLLVGLGSRVLAASSTNNSIVPTEYFANYKIQKQRNRLLEIFVEIDADSRTGKIWPSSLYAELYTIMTKIFPYFPQEYTFQVVYKQCQQATKTMAASATRENFNSFNENCKVPITAITNTIQNKYAVKASASLSPSSGPAPLTVTFDARASTDPSNETIPSRNYFWYYRDIDGTDKPIGYGPVVNYKFNESWTYIVHLTVRSSNTGIFDGEATVSVNVSPKSANVIVYTNGKKMTKQKPLKVGVQEAKKGIVFDGSATLPMGWREILSHQWSITSRDGFKYSRAGDWKPGYINLSLPSQGEFIVSLSVADNERNTVTENFSLAVSDPVATIQQTPDKGTTSTTFSFSAAASYSLTSRIKLYTWELFDSDGNKLDTLQGKEVKKQFKKPGNYTVKLTVEDEIWQKNIDTVNLYVESTAPIPQFTITPTSTWLYPSEFTFNADSTNDVDATNGYDALTYEWKFSSPDVVKYVSEQNDKRRVTVLFNEPGTHKVTLVVTDKYGQISEISKDVVVQSVLRPQLKATPRAAVWESYITFEASSNKNILSYERDFGDGSTIRQNTEAIQKHKYSKVWNYRVTLKVTDDSWSTNTVYETVYVGEKDSPIISYAVKDEYGTVLGENDKCEIWSWQTVSAYRVDRQKRFSIDTSTSVNSQWVNNNLRYYFQVKNDEIIQNQNFSYKFPALWCQYIDYTLEDTSLGKNVKQRIWFRVVNALPKLSNVTLLLPQYGNEIGIGFQQTANKAQDIFNTNKIDPVIVKVTAENAQDSDGAISYFKWYYYPKDNPNKILETRVSPWNIPYTYFSIPRQPWEFVFGVKMFDNDDGVQTSEDILWNGPLIMFPNDGTQPDIPIVTLKASTIATEVGQEVTFDVISKVLSDRPDFVKSRVIHIDFDGDGNDDLVTKDDRITYTYTTPSPANQPYKPVAKVYYRDYMGIGESAPITVRNAVKPALIYASMGNTVLFKDVSLGTIIEREICRDVRQCEKGNQAYLDVGKLNLKDANATLKKTFKMTYPKAGTYTVRIKAKDANANEASSTIDVKVGSQSALTTLTTGLQLLTLPEASKKSDWTPEIFLGKQLNNEVMLYVKTASSTDKCRIDTDITVDSNLDTKPDNDPEFSCNRIINKIYQPVSESIMGRIYYQPTGSKKLFKKDFTVTFADYENKLLDDDLKLQYTKLNQLIAWIDDAKSIANADLKLLLISLRNDLGDVQKTRGNVIQVEDYLAKKTTKLSKKQQDLLNSVLIALSDHATIGAKWGSAYEVSKAAILQILPLTLQQSTNANFNKFENADSAVLSGKSVQDFRLDLLNTIYSEIWAKSVEGTTFRDDEIDRADFKSEIVPNLCTIATTYQIVPDFCKDQLQWSDSFKAPPTNVIENTDNSSNSWGLPTAIKVLLWIVGIVAVWFVGVISFFAIKARIRQAKEEEE